MGLPGGAASGRVPVCEAAALPLMQMLRRLQVQQARLIAAEAAATDANKLYAAAAERVTAAYAAAAKQ